MTGKIWAHYTLMMAVDFRPRSRAELFGAMFAVPMHTALVVALALNLVTDFRTGELHPAWGPVAVIGIIFWSELVLIFVLQVCTALSVRLRRRLFARMMGLRRETPRIAANARTVHTVMASRWRAILAQHGVLAFLVGFAALLGLLNRLGWID